MRIIASEILEFIKGGIMNRLKNFLRTLWNDESGQGTAEYVLLIAIVVGLIVIFKDKIMGTMRSKIDDVMGGIQGVTVENK